jgi:hypothetical protein
VLAQDAEAATVLAAAAEPDLLTASGLPAVAFVGDGTERRFADIDAYLLRRPAPPGTSDASTVQGDG